MLTIWGRCLIFRDWLGRDIGDSDTWYPDRVTWEWGGGKALCVCTAACGGVFLHRNKLESNVHLHRQVDDGALV